MKRLRGKSNQGSPHCASYAHRMFLNLLRRRRYRIHLKTRKKRKKNTRKHQNRHINKEKISTNGHQNPVLFYIGPICILVYMYINAALLFGFLLLVQILIISHLAYGGHGSFGAVNNMHTLSGYTYNINHIHSRTDSIGLNSQSSLFPDNNTLYLHINQTQLFGERRISFDHNYTREHLASWCDKRDCVLFTKLYSCGQCHIQPDDNRCDCNNMCICDCMTQKYVNNIVCDNTFVKCDGTKHKQWTLEFNNTCFSECDENCCKCTDKCTDNCNAIDLCTYTKASYPPCCTDYQGEAVCDGFIISNKYTTYKCASEYSTLCYDKTYSNEPRAACDNQKFDYKDDSSDCANLYPAISPTDNHTYNLSITTLNSTNVPSIIIHSTLSSSKHLKISPTNVSSVSPSITLSNLTIHSTISPSIHPTPTNSSLTPTYTPKNTATTTSLHLTNQPSESSTITSSTYPTITSKHHINIRSRTPTISPTNTINPTITPTSHPSNISGDTLTQTPSIYSTNN
eukprot:365325_1